MRHFTTEIPVEEKLNVDLIFTDTGVYSSDVGNAIRSMVMSGDTTYDIFNVVQWNSASLVTEGVFRNLIDLPYVDVEMPWWSDYYISEINIGKNNRYFLCGDISIDTIRCISCMYFNKAIYEDYYGNPDNLYQIVLDGNWTLDKLLTLMSKKFMPTSTATTKSMKVTDSTAAQQLQQHRRTVLWCRSSYYRPRRRRYSLSDT